MRNIYNAYVFIIFIGSVFKEIVSICWHSMIGSIYNMLVRRSINKGSWLCKNFSVLYKDIHMDTMFIFRLISGIMKLSCTAIRFNLPDCLELMLFLFIRILYKPHDDNTMKLKTMQSISYKLEEIWFIHQFCQGTIFDESELKNDKGEIILPLITLFQHRDKQSETYATFYHVGYTDKGRSTFDITIWLSDVNMVKLEKMLELVDNVNKKMCEHYFNNNIKEVFNLSIERVDRNHARVVIKFEMEAYTNTIFNGAKISLLPV